MLLGIFAGSVIVAVQHAASADDAAKSQNRFPEFSWDRIPLYMHVRKATTFDENEIAFLAKFPLITFEKATGHQDHGSVEAGTLVAARAVKELNPKAKILYYRNVIVHYENYAADSELEAMPHAFLVGKDGNENLVRGRVKSYDLSNPAVRDWWVRSCQNMVADPAIDGVFLDGNIKALEAGYLRSDIGDAKKKETMDGYHKMIKQTREAIGTNELMVANILRARFPNGGLEYLPMFDGSYLEGFFHNVGSVSYEDYVAKGIATIQTAAQSGKIIAFTSGLSGAGNGSEMGIDEAHGQVASDEEAAAALTYPLALFLICAEKYSYFRVHEGYAADDNSKWMRWFPEYDRPLGPPDGPAQRNGHLYHRSFEHAEVWLDIKKRVGKINWKP
jgi:hypothetical protein